MAYDIAVLGFWHLGSVAAAGWVTCGKRVVVWDPDPALRELAAERRTAVIEPGVTEAFAGGAAGSFDVGESAEMTVQSAPVSHLAFDTQLDEHNRTADPRLDDAVQVFVDSAPDGALLLVSSQVPVGSCSRWRAQLEAAGRGLAIAHAPENLRLGRALEDFLHPSRLPIGADDEATFGRAAALFEAIDGSPARTSLASAEMAKHATNAYLALCIAFANELATVAVAEGADPAEVIETLRADPRVSPTAPLRPGTAFSGATLVRDLTTLADVGERIGRGEFFRAVMDANERHGRVSVAWTTGALGSLEGRELAVAGLTYKPGTSTLRDSLPLRVCADIVNAGARVRAWDPDAESFAPPDGMTRVETLAAAVEGADALLVLTALPDLASIEWSDLAPANRLVVDTCSVVDRGAAEAAGWAYRGFASP